MVWYAQPIMSNARTLYLIVFVTMLSLSAVAPTQAAASGGCLTVNNGGITTQQYCPTPPATATLSLTEAAPTKAPTSNGQPVFPSSKSKTTPNTGPEDWVLPSLFLLGGIGFLLRKKSNNSIAR